VPGKSSGSCTAQSSSWRRAREDRASRGEKGAVFDDGAVHVRVRSDQHVVAQPCRRVSAPAYQCVLHHDGALANHDLAAFSGHDGAEQDPRVGADVHIAAPAASARHPVSIVSAEEDLRDRVRTLVASPDCRDRIRAVALLRRRRDAEAVELLARLLRDPVDTAPVEAAAEMLVEEGDEVAWDLVFAAFGDEPDDDEHLSMFIGYGPPEYEARILEAAWARTAVAVDPAVRRGAIEFLEWKSPPESPAAPGSGPGP
jgi:hypothetical protein